MDNAKQASLNAGVVLVVVVVAVVEMYVFCELTAFFLIAQCAAWVMMGTYCIDYLCGDLRLCGLDNNIVEHQFRGAMEVKLVTV